MIGKSRGSFANTIADPRWRNFHPTSRRTPFDLALAVEQRVDRRPHFWPALEKRPRSSAFPSSPRIHFRASRHPRAGECESPSSYQPARKSSFRIFRRDKRHLFEPARRSKSRAYGTRDFACAPVRSSVSLRRSHCRLDRTIVALSRENISSRCTP